MGEVPIVFLSSLHFGRRTRKPRRRAHTQGRRDEDKARPELGVSLDLSSRFSHRHKPAKGRG